MARTRPCTKHIRDGRLRKATGFLNNAHLLRESAEHAEEVADTYVSLCVLAGIAASDVICCARLGEQSTGENHDQAITLLGTAEKGSARHLRTLLSMKTKAGYSESAATPNECKRAERAVEALVETARRSHAAAGG